MAKVNFCYQISEEAKVAVTEDGNCTKSYTKVSLDLEIPFTEEEYKRLHEVVFIRALASQLALKDGLLTPITYEEYLEDADDE